MRKVILFAKKFLKALKVFISRVLADGGIIEAKNYVNSLLKTVGDASLVLIPSAYKSGVLYSILPEDGTGDFTFSRPSGATRVNSQGLIEEVSLIGAELVTNGGFDNGIVGWFPETTGGSNTNISNVNNTLRVTLLDVSNPKAYTEITTEIGKTYKITCDFINGTVALDNYRFRVGTTFISLDVLDETVSSGSSEFTFISTATTLYVHSVGVSSVIGSYYDIDNVSVVEVFEEGIPRIDYTDGTPVLLTEPQSTNLVTYSEDFDTSAWTKFSGASVSTHVSIVAPDGTLTSQHIDLSANNSAVFINNASFVANGSTRSIYARTISGTGKMNLLRLFTSDGYGAGTGEYDLTTEWQRFDLTNDGTASDDGYFIACDSRGSGVDLTEVLIWGAQVEALPYATSYIPTEGTTATRLGEAVTDGGDVNTFNSEEGVLFMEVATLTYVEGSEDMRISLSDETTNNFININFFNTGLFQVVMKVAGTFVYAYSLSAFDTRNPFKIAFKYKENDFSLFLNGDKINEDFIGVSFPVNTLVDINLTDVNKNLPFYGKTKQIQVFKTALTDLELTELTTI